MKRFTLLAGIAAFMLVTASVGSARPVQSATDHVMARLRPVGGSGVTGLVQLQQLPRDRGTHITVVAFGLMPGHRYISLYYENHTCRLEPYSAEDVIGGVYTANGGGVGTTRGNADDDLGEINSVSVRDAMTFQLLACADVHPGG